MKAILVIDMPDNCAECQFCGFGGRDLEKYVCCLTREHSDDTHMVGCPLKPLPQKKKVEVNEIEDIMQVEYSIEDIYTNKYIANIRLATDKLMSLGWNACIDEILGGTE